MIQTTAEFVNRLLPIRDRDAHKGMFGKILLLCGSVGFTGAAALAARAALRTGSGLIFLGVPEQIYPILATKLDEPMVFPLPGDGSGKLSATALPEILRRLAVCDACLLGPGLGQSEDIRKITEAVCLASRIPLVLDADGLNVLSGHIDVLRGTDCPKILTPHEGEFRRLNGDFLPQHRRKAAEDLARQTRSILVLKGHQTLITDGSETWCNETGNPGMGTGGSGDVLAGILVSLLGQGITPLAAAAAAAWLHGTAGDLAARETGEYGLTPTDLIRALPRLLK